MRPAFSQGNRYWWLILAYVLAKLLEFFDVDVLVVLDVLEVLSVVSGHTLKHLVATFGCCYYYKATKSTLIWRCRIRETFPTIS